MAPNGRLKNFLGATNRVDMGTGIHNYTTECVLTSSHILRECVAREQNQGGDQSLAEGSHRAGNSANKGRCGAQRGAALDILYDGRRTPWTGKRRGEDARVDCCAYDPARKTCADAHVMHSTIDTLSAHSKHCTEEDTDMDASTRLWY